MTYDEKDIKEAPKYSVTTSADVWAAGDLTNGPLSQYGDEKSICDSMADATLRDDGLIDIRLSSIARLLQAVQAQKSEAFDRRSRYTTSSEQEGLQSIAPAKLNIVIQVVGSLGDVQPFISIAHSLQDAGHYVRLATHTVFKRMVESHNIEFFDIGGDPAELMAFMVRNPGLLPSGRSTFSGELDDKRIVLRGMMERCWKSCFEPGQPPATLEVMSDVPRQQLRPFVADAIIANPPAFAHIHCAERLGIPLHMVFTYALSRDVQMGFKGDTDRGFRMPWTPTRAFPHPLARVKSTRMNETMTNYLSYLVIDMVVWQGLRSEINSFRRDTLHLEPLDAVWAPAMLSRLGIPTSYCWSPNLLPKPKDWTEEVDVAGFCWSPDSTDEYTPSRQLLDFLHNGSTPIYIGFGSIVVGDPEALTTLVLDAVRQAGVRAIVSQGWSHVGVGLANTDQLYFIKDCPHAWLFKHVACVVHHGGSGTTASGLKAGKPTVTVPFFGDQFFWASRVEAAGAGPSPLPYKQLTAETLAARIMSALNPDYSNRAQMLATTLSREDGASGVRDSFHRGLPLEAMRCSLEPHRPAAWRIKRAGAELDLSSFAVAVLTENKLIEPKSLSRLRPVKYNIDQGPMEPVSGAVTAVTALFYGVGKGVVEAMTSVEPLISHSSDRRRSSTSKEKAYSTLTGPRFPTAKDKRAANNDIPKTRNIPIVTGCANVVLAVARSPMAFSLALAKGAHNAPILWGDTTVREVPEVTGIRSGVVIGCKELALGTYDGVAGLVRLPVVGARENGMLGGLTGVGKGLAGAPMKWFSAMAAPVGYPLKGVDVSMGKIFARRGADAVERALLARGDYELMHATMSEKQAVLKRWNDLVIS